MSNHDDPFQEARAKCPIHVGTFQGARVPMILRLKDVREAELWVSWGIHVFKDGDGKSKGPFMEKYSQQMFETAAENPGDDFFSALNEAKFEGRPLTMEEKLGYANIAFAGGRDTIIHTVTRTISYFAENPQALAWIRENPDRITLASEEFFRVFIPLTHIGRICPVKTDVHGFEVQLDGLVSLCWSSANRDPEVFAEPNEVRLDRKPNPHVAFGFGAHLCLGAHHARAIMRGLIQILAERVSNIAILETVELIEREPDYTRKIGYELLRTKFTKL